MSLGEKRRAPAVSYSCDDPLHASRMTNASHLATWLGLRYKAATLVIAASAFFLLAAMSSAFAQVETVLYTFTNGTDGSQPSAVVVDTAGNVYGTTGSGGANFFGNVFKITPSGTFSNLYSFTGEPDGFFPFAGLTIDGKGNLYGTTAQGGDFSGGTVFQLTPSGIKTILHSFSCQTDGCLPDANMTFDTQGNLYGTTESGGAYNFGVVFKVSTTGTFSVLHSFTVPSRDATSSVAVDKQGNVYGTAENGGAPGYGSVFKLTPSGQESILHSFAPKGRDGFYPYAGVIVDGSGNLYGTTTNGGTTGVGTLFEISPAGSETVLHNFAGGSDGLFPNSGVVFDGKGNLFGTTSYGGSFDLGTVYMFTSAGVQKIVHSFALNKADGKFPNVGVVFDGNGNLYGSTSQGGSSTACQGGCGVVYKIAP